MHAPNAAPQNAPKLLVKTAAAALVLRFLHSPVDAKGV